MNYSILLPSKNIKIINLKSNTNLPNFIKFREGHDMKFKYEQDKRKFRQQLNWFWLLQTVAMLTWDRRLIKHRSVWREKTLNIKELSLGNKLTKAAFYIAWNISMWVGCCWLFCSLNVKMSILYWDCSFEVLLLFFNGTKW